MNRPGLTRSSFPRSVALVCAVASTLMSALAAFAQSATGAADPADEPIVLSTYSVQSQRDFGYRATNSITATGVGTEIYRTPISVSVVTKDLITDIGAEGLLREALQYTAGLTTDSRDPNQYTARGFLAPVLVNRVGGTIRNPVSDFVERVEIAKGPNSVFYGRVAPGGLINLTTLQPKSRTETVLKLVGGSYDYGRVVLDHSHVVNEQFGVRVAGSFLNRDDGYYDFTYQRQNAGYISASWQISDKIVLNANASYTDAKQNQPHSGARSHPAYLANPANNNVTIQAWAAATTTPLGLPGITIFADDIAYLNGDRGNNNGPEAFKLDRGRMFQAELIARPTSALTFRAAATQSDTSFQTLEISGFPTPDGTIRNQRGTWLGGDLGTTTVEAELVGEWKIGGTTHRSLAGARYAENESRTFAVQTNPTTWNNRTMGPRFLTTHFPQPWGFRPSSFVDSEGTETAFYFAHQAGFREDRLKFLAGLRHTEVGNQANAGQSTLSASDTTPQVGFSLEVAPSLAVFANYSRTFEPQFQTDVFGKIAPNVEGEGKEIGVKSRAFDGALSGSLSVFEVLREGEARRDFLRETAEGRSPIFIAGGSSRTRGLELEFTWTPLTNYQLLFAYAWLWESEVIQDTASPILVGRRLAMSPEHQVALWQRYTFREGALKGLAFGGGVRHQHNTQATLQPLFGVALENATPVDLFVAYEASVFGRPVKYQLNAKNIFSEKYHDSSSLMADPLTVYLTVELKF